MAAPAAPGDRHSQMIDLALPLIGNGMAPQAVFAQLRAMYDATVPDSEIESVVAWALAKNPSPSGYGNRLPYNLAPSPRPALPVTAQSATAAVEGYLKGERFDEADLWEVSPWRPLEDWRKDSIMVFAALFFGHEYVNIVTDLAPLKDGSQTKLRDDWMRHFREHGVPQSKSGAWFRFNPTTEKGTGKSGWHTDDDVTAFRFMLIESDKLPMELQLSFLGKLRLPVAALISSGGKSIHCLVKMDCKSIEEYREQAVRILKMLRVYGFDTANKNPSRMSRLPGAFREIGARGDGQQRLLYLNPEPVEGERIFP